MSHTIHKKPFDRHACLQGGQIQRYSCGKMVWSSQAAARKAARVIESRMGAHQRPYQCWYCMEWHLTSHRFVPLHLGGNEAT